MATTIAICSQKGGVAKTTTCLALAACLAEIRRNVLVIDLDPQAHLTLSLGLEPETVRRTIEDVILGYASLVSVSRESSMLGLDIVPANHRLTLVDKVLYKRKGYEFHIRNSLDAVNGYYYDVVLMDCPPAFGTLTINALTAADLLIIPVQCEYFAAQSLVQIVELAKLVRERTNPRLKYRMLVTMYDQRNKICQIILERMRQGLGKVLFNTIIEVDTRLRECPAYGKPITQYAPETRGAQQYRALVQELLNGRQYSQEST